jgi:hypothetical protein
LLWKQVTGLLAPTSYYEEHRQAARRNHNVTSILAKSSKAA